MIKRLILQENVIILNWYAPNKRASKYMRQKLVELQGEIDESTVVFGDFKTTPTVMNRSSRQKVSNYTVDLNSTINQLDLIAKYILLH